VTKTINLYDLTGIAIHDDRPFCGFGDERAGASVIRPQAKMHDFVSVTLQSDADRNKTWSVDRPRQSQP